MVRTCNCTKMKFVGIGSVWEALRKYIFDARSRLIRELRRLMEGLKKGTDRFNEGTKEKCTIF